MDIDNGPVHPVHLHSEDLCWKSLWSFTKAGTNSMISTCIVEFLQVDAKVRTMMWRRIHKALSSLNLFIHKKPNTNTQRTPRAVNKAQINIFLAN